MTEQLSLEIDLKKDGMARAAKANNFGLQLARNYAAKFCAEHRGFEKYAKALERYPEYPPCRAITSEDVRAGIGLILVKRYSTKWQDRYLNNFMGSVFTNGEYTNTGLQWKTSIKGQHHRAITIWVKK
jgi:hypothetical protein